MSLFDENSNQSWLQQTGVVDLFKIYSDFQGAKLANKNTSTLNELNGQVSLLTMQRDMMNNYMQNAMMANNASVTGNLGQYLPIILVVGVAAVVVYVVTK